MKRFYAYILISALFFPAFGRVLAAATPISTQSPAIAPIVFTSTDIDTQLHSILDRLTDLSHQTQTAADQISLNGIDITGAQTNLDIATTDLIKTKNILNIAKYNQKDAETQLQDARNNILQSLAQLKSSLVTLNQNNQ